MAADRIPVTRQLLPRSRPAIHNAPPSPQGHSDASPTYPSAHMPSRPPHPPCAPGSARRSPRDGWSPPKPSPETSSGTRGRVMSARFIRLSNAVRVISDIGRPGFVPGNTSSSPRPRTASRIAIAEAVSGTRCSVPAFIRSAGMVHILSPASISDHRAPRTSPDRAHVRIANCSAREERASFSRSCVMKAGTSVQGRALWCLARSFVSLR